MAEEEKGSSGDPQQGAGSREAGSGRELGPGYESNGSSSVEEPTAGGEPQETPQAEIISPTTGMFQVKLGVYDGPLDLLLDLIKKNEMNIYDIQVSVITEQYLEYLSSLKKLDLDIAGEYIVMAATLMYIKSKMLLPVDETTEEDDGEDPRAELVKKLLEYQAFKEAAKELGMMETERGKVYTRQISDYYLSQIDPEDVEVDTFSANLFDLLSAFQKVLSQHKKEIFHEVFEEVVSIEERMSDLKGALLSKKKVVFSSLFEKGWSKNLLIVTFLAILELVRTKFAVVSQDEQYGDIVIEKKQYEFENTSQSTVTE